MSNWLFLNESKSEFKSIIYLFFRNIRFLKKKDLVKLMLPPPFFFSGTKNLSLQSSLQYVKMKTFIE